MNALSSGLGYSTAPGGIERLNGTYRDMYVSIRVYLNLFISTYTILLDKHFNLWYNRDIIE